MLIRGGRVKDLPVCVITLSAERWTHRASRTAISRVRNTGSKATERERNSKYAKT